MKKLKLEYSNKNIIIGSIVFFVCIIALYYIYKYIKIDYFNKDIKNMQVEVVKRPFLNLYAVKKDGSEVATNIIFITHSFTRDDCEINYNDYKKKRNVFSRFKFVFRISWTY